MSNDLTFTDKVAVVTGSGNGLGRAHALMLAARGAKVVVNDLGGSFTGEGASANAADKVVAEIREAGGTAVANYDSVEDGEKIIKTATDEYGRVDIVVNNAGILRDVSFHKMSQQDWDLVYKVHVLGAFRVTHAAWPIMREQGFGRIIMTASAAGIYGNFGQANYSMAKLGLAGLANTLAIEGRRKNIHVNTIAPLAGSRMTATVLPQELLDALRPEYVTPLVAWLCHEDCEETGGLFEVGGGFMAKLRWERSAGTTFRLGRDVTPERVKDQWSQISGFEKSTHPEHVAGSMQPIMENIEAGPSKGGNELIDVDLALDYEFDPVSSSYDERDVALYALGVGAAHDPTDDHDLQYVYEMHGKGMHTLPTFGVIPALGVMLDAYKAGKLAPGLNYGFDRILHGEQYTEVKRPLPTHGKLTHKARIKDIFDKGKHALVITETVSYDEDGNELVRNELTGLIKGAGGWGGDRGPSADVNAPPDRAPDASVEETIPVNQALLYRLTGDINPLHADPSFAKAFGFDRPILHGLCTFGFAGRHVISAFAKNADARYFKSIRVRFADSVFPGETLVTEMWKESEDKIIFRSRVKERDSIVISNAAVELYREIPKPASKPKTASKGSEAKVRTTSGDIFRAIGNFLTATPSIAEKVKTTFLFKLSGPDSAWTIDLSSPPGSVAEGGNEAKCTLEMTDGDFMDMATGKADAMKLFSTGKLKIAGDVMASQKLSFLKKLTPEMVMAETKKRAGGAPAAAEPEAKSEPTTWDVFIAIRDHIERHPEMASKIGYVFQFKVTSPDSTWTVDLKNDKGAVGEGETVPPDCTLEIAESDFIDMTKGASDPMKLFTTGKLKIAGNVMASQKLEFLKQIDPDAARAAVAKARAAGHGPGVAKPMSSAEDKAAKAPSVFAALEAHVSKNPNLKDEIQAGIQFVITGPNDSWFADFSGATASITQGSGEASATLTLADGDLADLAHGKTSTRDLFQRGKLRVDGDIALARKLSFIEGLI